MRAIGGQVIASCGDLQHTHEELCGCTWFASGIMLVGLITASLCITGQPPDDGAAVDLPGMITASLCITGQPSDDGAAAAPGPASGSAAVFCQRCFTGHPDILAARQPGASGEQLPSWLLDPSPSLWPVCPRRRLCFEPSLRGHSTGLLAPTCCR